MMLIKRIAIFISLISFLNFCLINTILGCISINSTTIDFGNVLKTDVKTQSIIVTPANTNGSELFSVIPTESWISVNPQTFYNNNSTIAITVTINGSKLPVGEMIEGYVKISGCNVTKDILIKCKKVKCNCAKIILKIGDSQAQLICGNDLPKFITLEAPAEVPKNRTFVPLRFISESLDSTIKWDPIDFSIKIKNETTTIDLTIGDKTAFINGAKYTLDEAPYLKNDRTMVPLRFIAQAFKCRVDWDDKTWTVSIVTCP